MPNFKTTTNEEAAKSGFIVIKNSADHVVNKIATTAPLQVGLSYQPSGLKITGDFSLGSVDVNIVAGETYACENSSSLINVFSTGSGSITIILPANPTLGQVLFIKDSAGRATTSNILIKGHDSQSIDGNSSVIISGDYGFLQLLWNSAQWSTVSSSEISSGAPNSAQYVVLSADATLTNERVLTAGSGISIVDAGAGSTITISATGGG
jgi:hypothetical protein